MYVKVMLTLLVIATGALALSLRPAAQTIAVQPVTAPALCEAEIALGQPLGAYNIENVTTQQAIDALALKARVRIVVLWDSFMPGGDLAALRRRQTFAGDTTTLKDALYDVLGPVAGRLKLAYNASGSTVTVATVEHMPADQFTVRLYDVNDLLTDRYWASESNPFDSPSNFRMDSLQGLLSEMVLDGWSTKPGSIQIYQSIHHFAGRLIVTTTPRGQQQVQEVLALLRQAR